jgi:hypothetical protein
MSPGSLKSVIDNHPKEINQSYVYLCVPIVTWQDRSQPYVLSHAPIIIGLRLP